MMGSAGAEVFTLTALPYSSDATDLSRIAAAHGKMAWMHKALPGANQTILCPKRAKWRLASPSSLLLDDDEENCADFAKAGGAAIRYDPAAASEAVIRHATVCAQPGEVVEL